MTRFRVLALTLLALPASPARAQPAQASQPFTVEQIADGVFAFQRTKPPGYLVAANNLVIVGEEDVVVVDTDMTMAGAAQVIDAIRRITPKPVRYVITTHWHDDHVIGNRAFVDAYPGVEFIAHAATVAAMTADALTMRETALRDWPAVMDGVRALVDSAKWTDGSPLPSADAAILESDLDLGKRYLAQIPEVKETLPTILVDDRLVLKHGARTIDIRFAGEAATEGDLVVFIPDAGVIATGDLLTWPVLFGAVSSVGGWSSALDTLAALPHAVIVPGHGPVMRSDREIGFVRDLLREVRSQAADAIRRGDTLDEFRSAVRLDRFRSEVAADSKLRASLFDAYFVGPILPLAFAEAQAASG